MPIELRGWEAVGELTPILYNRWYEFSGSGTSNFYRLEFYSNNFEAIKSFGWLRPSFTFNSQTIVGRAQRIYPKPEMQLIELPIPTTLKRVGVNQQSFSLKKISKYPSVTSDWLWKIKLEALLVEGEETTELNLDLINAKLNLLLNQF